MSTQPKHYFTPEEYLELELRAESKHEYFDGEIYLMSGASERAPRLDRDESCFRVEIKARKRFMQNLFDRFPRAC